MKERLLGYFLFGLIVVLIFAWWLPKSHNAFWLILIGGGGLYFAGIYLSVVSRSRDTTLGSAQFGSRADVNALAKNNGDLLIGRDTFGRIDRKSVV